MTRLIYSNYNLDDNYADIKAFIMDEYPDLCTVEVKDSNNNISYEPDEVTIWDFIEADDEISFDSVYKDLEHYFADKKLIMFGSVGRWDGTFTGFNVGTFKDLFNDIMEDCDYVEITDEDGLLRIKCSHHDGTNYVCIKELTDTGYEVYDNWDYNCGKFSDYSCEAIGKLLIGLNFYSRLPRFVKKVWGC